MQTHTPLRVHLTPVKMATIKNCEDECQRERLEKGELWFTARVRINTAITEISLDISQKNQR